MNSRKKSSVKLFGIGIILCILLGTLIIIKKDLNLISGFGFLIGFYLICYHGFLKKPSDWKVKPIYFVSLTCLILFGLYKYQNKEDLISTNSSSIHVVKHNNSNLSIKSYDTLTNQKRYSFKTKNHKTFVKTSFFNRDLPKIQEYIQQKSHDYQKVELEDGVEKKYKDVYNILMDRNYKLGNILPNAVEKSTINLNPGFQKILDTLGKNR